MSSSSDQQQRPLVGSGVSSGSNLDNLQRRPRYGPVFAIDEEEFFKNIKDKAWEHVTKDKPGAEIGITSSVRSIQSEARDSYADGTLVNLEGNVFLYMLVKDACFFLQLVLFWFGCQLGYPPEHVIFGHNGDENQLRRWLECMFIVGNQVPLVVFEKLMGQNFFELALMERMTTSWKKQPVGLMEKVLYEFLLVPASSNNQNGGPALPTCLQGPIPKPCDLLHGMYLMVLGPTNDPNEENGREFSIMIGAAAGDNYADNAMTTFPSAKELREAGIHFEGVEGMGSRGISFTPGMFRGSLRLPRLVVDDSTGLLFENLEAYEMAQQFIIREVGSYLWFMRELVRTIEDAKILESQGVIKGQIENLPGILMCGSASRENIGLSRKLYDIKLQINEFSRPRFQKLKTFVKYSFSGAVLVGVIFTVLQYFKKEHS